MLVILLLLGITVFSLAFVTKASAATGINHQINFQGKLVNTDGTNVTDGTYSIIFSLYTVSSGGSNIWTETQSSVSLSDGIFQVNLGSVTTLPGSVDFNTDNLYLGIKVGADAEMTPRVQFTAVPQAFNSEKLGGLDKTGFIQNQTASPQTAGFNISGNGSLGGTLSVTSTSNLIGALTLGTASSATGQLKFANSSSAFTATIQSAAYAQNTVITLPATGATDTLCLQTLANCGGGSGVTTVGTYSTSNTAAGGATISGTSIIFQDASASAPGMIGTGAQTLAGVKTFSSQVVLSAGVQVASQKTIDFVGGTTAQRPASPTAGMLYYDTSTNSMLQYNGSKWVSDHSSSTKIVAASNSSQAIKDAADYVASGTDDGSTINTALTAASGGTVYLAEGSYSLTSANPISIPNNTALVGAGTGTLITIPNAQNGTYNMITNTDTSTGTNITIRDLFLDGNKVNQTSGTMYGIYLDHMGTGSTATAKPGASISHMLIMNMKNGAAVKLVNSYNNTITANTGQSLTNGIVVNLSSNNVITSNSFRGIGAAGVDLENSSNYNTVSGNISQTVGYGVYMDSSSANTVAGNTIQSPSQGIVFTNSASNNTASGNTINTSGSYGVILSVGANNNTVSGNNISDSGGATANNGIYLDAADANSFIGNSITDSSCSTNCYAINIFNSTSDNNYLADNRFSDTDATQTASINDSGTGTVYANQARGIDGGQLTVRTANSAGAFGVQNATGTDVLTVDTSVGTTTLRGTTSASDAAVLGSESFTGGKVFNAATGWTSISGTDQTATATHTAGGGTTAITTSFTPIAGATYQVQFTLSGNTSSGSVNVSLGAGLSAGALANATHTMTLMGVTTASLQFTPSTNFNGTITAISVIPITISNSVFTLQASTSYVSLETRIGTINTRNQYMGLLSGQSNTTGADNTAFGDKALQGNTSGSRNSAFGSFALQGNSTGSNNTAVGYDALEFNTTGASNTAVGQNALRINSTGGQNTAVGNTSLLVNSSGSLNTALGANSLQSNTTGSNNTAIGFNALLLNTSGNNNVAAGDYALYSTTTGSNNTGSGHNALQNLKTQTNTISATVTNAGNAKFTTPSTTGLVAGMSLTISGTTSYNGTVTVLSVNTSTTFTISTAFSTADTTGSWTTAESDSNTAYGYQAGVGTTNGYSAIGNSLFGYNTGLALQPGSNYNTVMGYAAGVAMTTGASNLLLGANAGANLTSGSNNIIIGQGTTASSATVSNYLNIGGLIQGDLSGLTIALNGTTTLATNKNLTYTSGSGTFDQSASTGTFATGTGAVTLNGDTTVATGKSLTVNTIQSAASTALTVTGTTTLTLASTGANAVSLDSGTTGQVNIGGNANNKTINIGATGSTNAASTIHIADTSANQAQAVTIGNTASTSSTLTLQAGKTTQTITNTGALIKTASGGDSTTAFQVQDSNSSAIFLVDTAGQDNNLNTNLISNPGFENGVTGWTGSGTGASCTQNLPSSSANVAKIYYGMASLDCTTASSGTTTVTVTGFNSTLSAGTYNFSFYAKASGTVTLSSTVTFTGGGANCTNLTPTSITTTGFQRFSCTVTTSGTTTDIQMTTATNSLHVYLDSVQLTSGGTTLYPYRNGNIQLRGVVNNPATFMNMSDSTTSFQIQNASAASMFTVDTYNNIIQIGSATANTTGVLLVLNNNSSTTEPNGVNGAIYYNTGGVGGANGTSGYEGKFRCYEASMWKNCIGMRDVSERRWGFITPQDLANSTAPTTFVGSGGTTAPTAPTGTLAADANTESYYVKATDAGTAASVGGWNTFTTTNLKTETRWLPKLYTRIRVDSSSVGAAGTNTTRYWVALSSASMSGVEPTIAQVANATAQYIGVGASNIANSNSMTWICGAGNGTNHTGVNTGQSLTAGHYYDIILDYSRNGVLVCSVADNGGAYMTATNTNATHPTTTTALGIQETVTSVTAVSRAISIAYSFLEYR